MSVLPHGTWPSPIAPEALVAGQVGLDEVRPDGASTWWLELRPAEAGRVVLVRHDGTGTHDVLPAPGRCGPGSTSTAAARTPSPTGSSSSPTSTTGGCAGSTPGRPTPCR